MRTPLDFQRAAARSGCRLLATELLTFAGREVTGAEYLCPGVEDGDPWGGPRLLEALSESDATDPEMLALAERITQGAPSPARILHTYVQARVSFRREKRELFQAPALTDASGKGDCDDSERLLVALARSLGISARFVYFLKDRVPKHVSAQLLDPLTGAWTWAEVTIKARYGEEPLTALMRLGLKRPDIDGKAELMPGSGSVLGGLGQVGPDGHTIPDYVDLSGSFAQALVRETSGIVADPLDALRMLLHESGLDPSIDNGVASGIFQLLNENVTSHTGLSNTAFKQLSAEEQLPYWRSYLVGTGRKGMPLSGRDLYWKNFVPATYIEGAPDDQPLVTSDDHYVLPSGARVHLSGVYTQNAGLDHGQKGVITAGDMGLAIGDGEREHPHIFAALAPQIQSGGGPSGGIAAVSSVTLFAGLIAAGAAAWILTDSPRRRAGAIL